MDFELNHAVDVLRRTPSTLTSLLGGIDDVWARADEGPETFSPFDVVGHLVDGEETDWIPRARHILDRRQDAFEPYDRFRHRERNADRRLSSLLDEFRTLREANLAQLSSWELSDEQLELRGLHPALGTVTLRRLLATWVTHDLGHIAQIVRVMAKQYRHEVGPWRQYLPILELGPKMDP